MKYRVLLEQKTKLKEEAAAILAKADEEERHLSEEEKPRLKEIEAGLDQIEEDLAIREKFRNMDLSKTDNIHDLSDGNGSGVQKPEEPVFQGDYALGEFCCAVARYYTSGGLEFDPKLRAAAAGLSSDVPSAGGFGVQQDMSAELWKRAYDVGGILSRVRRVRVGANSDGLKINAIDESSRATGSRFGGVVGYWLSQGDSITASKPKLRQVSLSLKKLGALCYATDELLKDSAAMQDVIMSAVPEELSFMAEDAIFNGTGGGMPTGIMNSGAVITVSAVTGQGASTFVYQNAVDMWARMWGKSYPNAIWAYDQSATTQLYTMSIPVGTGGSAVFMPAGGASAAPYATIFNRPMVPIEYAQALGTAGDVILMDPTQYVIIEKGGIEPSSSMHVRFTTDEMTFRFIYRVDGQSLWDTTLTPKSGGNSVSPFLILNSTRT